MKSYPKISVVIVTYNAANYIIPAIRSILKSRDIVIEEVIIVDNASSDSTIDYIKSHYGSDPRIKIIQLGKNVGFPLASNIGVAEANSDLVVIMNPDVIVSPSCLSNLAKIFYNERGVAIVQPKILHPGNYIDSAGGLMDILGHGFHIGKFEHDKNQYNELKEILYATFACVMVRRDIYLSLGGMDPRYFLYNEDLDISWRSWLLGFKVLYQPQAIAYHVGQHATKKIPYPALYFGRRNRLYTIFANHPLWLALPVTAILLFLYVGLAIKSMLIDRYESRITLEIIKNFMKNIRYLAIKRSYVIRKRSNIELVRKGLITLKLVGLKLHFRDLYRKQLKLYNQINSSVNRRW